MAVLHELIDPIELSNFVTDHLTQYEKSLPQTLAGYVPVDPIGGIDYVFETDPTRSYVAAKYRAWDASPTPIRLKTLIEIIRGELPPMSPISMLSEKDRINRLRVSGSKADFIEAVFADAAFLARAISDRFELQRGEAIANSSVAIAENDLNLDAITFTRDAAMTVAAPVLWSDPTADILNDMATWLREYRRTHSGQNPAAMVASDDVWYAMLGNDAFRELVNNAPIASITNAAIADDELRRIFGQRRWPTFVPFDREVTVVDDDMQNPTTERVLPADKVFFMPGEAVGRVLMGDPVIAGQSVGVTGDNLTNIVAATWSEPETEKLYTKATAVGLTVLGRSNDVMVADVL